MNPYYDDGKGIVIYHGDCRDILPTLPKSDLMLTDPVWPNCPEGLLEGWQDAMDLLRSCLQVIKSDRLVIVLRHDCDPRFLGAVPKRFPFFRVQILPYAIPGYIGRKLGGDELAYSFGEPLISKPGRRVIPGYAPKQQPAGRRANGHPCSRALGHFTYLVHWWSEENHTVIDPFCGSGTTLVACKQMNRSAVGIEIEERYIEIAIRRLDQEVLRFDEPKRQPAAVEASLFSNQS